MLSPYYHPTILPSYRKGFSTLMVLGTIGILLILVVGLASTYIREMKLSRTSYDEVLAYANAEGMFEYAMLKVRNHREGFADIVTNSDIDGKILMPSTDRSKGLQSSYEIQANSSDETFELNHNSHLIVPLFSSPGIPLSGPSKNPNINLNVNKTTGLNISGLNLSTSNLSWTIVAMSGGVSVGLTGSGDITASKNGIIRHKGIQCYSYNSTLIPTGADGTCDPNLIHQGYDSDTGTATQYGEELQYFYDEEVTVSSFINNHSDPYILIFNDSGTSRSIQFRATTPFSLPTLSIRSEAQKNDSVQVFEFTEDKSRYYDALKYGVYNAD